MVDMNIPTRAAPMKMQDGGAQHMMQARQMMPLCDLQSVDDNKSEFSVKTHSQFGTHSAGYFSQYPPQS